MIEDNLHDEIQKKHKKVKIILRISGAILLICGIVFVIVGMVDLFQSMMDFDNNMMDFETGRTNKMWCLFCGIPLIPIGTGLLVLGFKKEMMSYVKNEAVPIINQVGREVSPAIENITAAVKRGTAKLNGITCTCGQINDSKSKFCKNCGKSLVQTCPNCNTQIDKDSKFCDNCGERLK